MSTTTVQWFLFLFICLCAALIIWGAVRNRALTQAIEEQRMSNRRVRDEVGATPLHGGAGGGIS